MKRMSQKHLAVIVIASALTLPVVVVATSVLASEEGHKEHTSVEQNDKAAHAEHDEDAGSDKHGEEHAEKEKMKIDSKAATDMKIEVSEAAPATIQVAIPVTGKVALNRNMIAEVRGRFEGIVKSVTKTEGEMVTAGETLATVESNESLQVYAVKAPIGGIILARNTNIGHVSGTESMFTVADLSKLWVEFNVFARDIARVTVGQKIRVTGVGSSLTVETTLLSILPVADSGSQTVIARAAIDNRNGEWRPGMSVHGEILTEEKSVPVAIKLSAIQRLEGKAVIFIEEDGTYEARNIKLGLQDGTNAEVLEGLSAGEKYVSANSFVLKAHAGKAGAEHVH